MSFVSQSKNWQLYNDFIFSHFLLLEAEVPVIEAELGSEDHSKNERVFLLGLAQACVRVTFSINSTVKIPNVQVLCIAFCKKSNGGAEHIEVNMGHFSHL